MNIWLNEPTRKINAGVASVLQRIDLHPIQQIIELTPRVWKERFSVNPITSDLEIAS
jgi:hypothetical protein